MGKGHGRRVLISLVILLFICISLTQTYSAEEATAIEITIQLSISECYPGDALWANGTALYDNLTPVLDSEVFIQITGNQMNWNTSLNPGGNYAKKISALGRFVDQTQPEAPVPSGYTGRINSATRIGQTFIPSASSIHSIDIYLVKSFPLSSSSVSVAIRASPTETSDLVNTSLTFDEIVDGWNNFVFPTSYELTPGTEYFILLSSNTTSGHYKNYGRPWGGGTDYVNGTVYWEGDPMMEDGGQDIGFYTYYEDPLSPGEYTINASVIGENSTQTLYGYDEATLTVVRRPIADILLTNENLSLSYLNDPPLEGDEVSVNVTFVNNGDAQAVDFNIDFSLDIESNVFDSQILTLDPFEVKPVSVIWMAEAGDHTIFVTADSSDIIVESYEINNNASIDIFVDGDNDSDGIGNLSDQDDDNDGYPDNLEIAQGTDPLNEMSKPPDNDVDFIPDSLDSDDDNDGYSDFIETQVGTDPFDNSSIPLDYDSDGVPDSLDSDIDNDGKLNEYDIFPYNCSEWQDTDSDGIGNNADLDDDADGVVDTEDKYPLDTDDDKLQNDIDWDDDADDILDWEDSYLLDTDNDGLRNDVDPDDDGDGLLDVDEVKKHTDSLKWDTDGDGVNDKKDFDPLDSDVTSDPGFEMLYLVVPIMAILILVLLGFIISRSGSHIKVGGADDKYKELHVSTVVSESKKPVASEDYLPTDKMAGSQASDELAGIREEVEETSLPQKDELADIEEEFEELSSSK